MADMPEMKERFFEMREYIGIYEEIDIDQMNTKFNAYLQKMTKEVLPFSKAKFTLNHMMIFHLNKDANRQNLVLERSLVQGTGKQIDFLNSPHFKQFLRHLILKKEDA